MRKQTDLAAMKQLARVFLMMDPEPTSFSPVIIKHPFTIQAIVTVRSVTNIEQPISQQMKR